MLANAPEWARPYGAATGPGQIDLRIDGQARATDNRYDIINPADETVIGHGAICSDQLLQEALASTERSQSGWARTSVHERAAILGRAADIIRAAVDDLALTMTLEQGKPLAQSRLEFILSAETLDWYAAEALRSYGRVLPPRTPGARQVVLPEPIGPVAAIAPWNFPALLVARKVAPALAAGCPCIIKPSEETVASGVAIADALHAAGLPAGVVNVVFGDPARMSSGLIASDVIRKVSFTGSVPVGKLLAEMSGRHMKPCTLELGGHAPVLVMDDVDPVRAAQISAVGKTRNSGQVCTSPTRFFVQDGIRDSFVDTFRTELEKMSVGRGDLPDTDMGPLANPRRIDAMEALVADAVSRGATLETGGKRIGNTGYMFMPTILSDVPDDAEIMTTEPFGPIAIVNRFSYLDDALEMANRSDVGLAGYAFTDIHSRAVAISETLKTGMIGINSFAVSHIEAPFGGVKDSGYGYEGGAEGLDAYLHRKYVHHA